MHIPSIEIFHKLFVYIFENKKKMKKPTFYSKFNFFLKLFLKQMQVTLQLRL
jgi:hypothetical protein